MRPSIRNISLATRLALVALVVTLVSLAVTATVGLVRGSELADDIVDERLTALSASRAASIDLYLTSVRRELSGVAASPSTAQTIGELTDALFELADEEVSAETSENVTDYYLSTVVPSLEAVRGPGQASVASLVPTGTPALLLQDAYTIQEPTEEGTVVSPELVLDPGDGSTYSSLHAEVHRTWSSIALRSGLDDVYLIEPTTESIVYSYRKRIEFGTSLDLGPHSGSALARAVDLASQGRDEQPRLTTMNRYAPAIDQPTMFIVSTVVDGGQIVGYVAYAISYERFDEILAGADPWSAFGVSGDAYLVDGSATMITTTRSLTDDRVAFREDSKEPGPGQLTDADRQRIAETGTTALVQTVPTDLVVDASEDATITDTTNFRGESVRSVTTRLPIEGVSWTLFVEAATAELDTTIEDYARDMLIAVALFVVAITFVAVRWSNRLVAPIRVISTRLRRARSIGDANADPIAALREQLPDLGPDAPSLPDGPPSPDDADVDPGPDEFVDLGQTVDEMLERLQERRAAVAERSRERTALLQQFLPAAIARRSEEADSEVLDHVRQASVAVLVVDGLGSMVGEDSEQQVRDLLGELVDEIDAIAADSGVERVKLSGSTYFAVCGAGRPLLDHAPRTVGFALRVRDAVDEMTDGRLTVRAGVAEGSVSVGLAERAAMIYDVWGDTATLAEELSGAAPTGTVLVSDVVAAHLSDEFVSAGGDDDGRLVVTGRIGEGVAT